MKEKGKKKKEKPSRKKGCLIFLVIAVGLVAFSFWQVGEPGRRAKGVYQTIRPDMNVMDVENLLMGRHYCFYQVKKDSDWQNLSQEDFMAVLAKQDTSSPVATRLQLTFMGMSPRRVSFFVEINGRGTVSRLTAPHGWD